MHAPRVTIVDYGVGNLHSLARAFAHCGVRCTISEEVRDVLEAQALVLPGVGAFAAGMRGLSVRGLADAIRERAAAGVPMLGICLGAQLLLTEGHEFGVTRGLDLIPGRVVPFPFSGSHEKIPHVGWNALQPTSGAPGDVTILRAVAPGSQVYFVHSYVLEPADPAHVLAVSTYGGHAFAAAIRRGTISGCQFHPEKSGAVGLRIIRNFIACIAA